MSMNEWMSILTIVRRIKRHSSCVDEETEAYRGKLVLRSAAGLVPKPGLQGCMGLAIIKTVFSSLLSFDLCHLFRSRANNAD